MSNVIISKLNGYRFVPKDLLELDPMYNTYEFDLVHYSHQIKDWEQNVYYAQTVQFSDPLSLQVLARIGGQIEIRLYDCEGKRYKVSPFPILMTNPVNAPTVSVGGNNKVYHAFYDEDFWEDLDANTYYLELRYNNQQLGITEVYVSEPIELRKLHKYTKLISYKNRYNKDFALFEQYNRRFYLRVPADLSLNIQGEKTVFTDGNNQSHLLVGSAIRVWDLTIGGQGKHIPAYLVDILNHIFHLDNIFIDNKRYTILEDSDLAMDTIRLYPLKVLNITLGEVDDNLMSSTSTGVADPPTIIEVGELPSDPDSVILPPGLNLGDLGNIIIPAPPLLSNSSTETIGGWLSNLNNLISTNYGIEGEFSIVGDTIIFNQPDDIPKGENAVYSIEFNVLSSMLVISGGIIDSFSFDIDIGVNEFIVITNNVNAEDESLVYYNMNTDRGSISVDASANSYKIYVKKDIESIIIENIEIIGDLVIESTDNALENIITFIVRNSSHDNFSLDIKSNSRHFEMLDISNMSNTNNINIDMARSLEFKNILLPSTGISSKIFNNIVELVHSNCLDAYLKEGKKIVYGVLDARGNGLFFDSLSQGIKDKIIQLREEVFWSVELGTLNALNLGGFYIKENGMIEIRAINLCGDYYTVTDSNGEVIEFNDIEAVISYLNGTFSNQASLIGSFSLNENNEIMYSNEEDFCEHSFIEFVV